MATVTLKGTPIHTVGDLPKVGSSRAGLQPAVPSDLSTVTGKDLAGEAGGAGNILPQRRHRDLRHLGAALQCRGGEAEQHRGAVRLQKDLPFAHKRFCGAEGIEQVHGVSDFRSPNFGKDYGVTFSDGPLQGLLSRAVVVIDAAGKVVYTEQVAEIANEPNYAGAITALA